VSSEYSSLVESGQNFAQIASEFGLDTFTLGNRRYLGSKTKLLTDIEAQVKQVLGRNPFSLMDAFAGSGVVAAHFAMLGSLVIGNDLLRHNTVALETFLLHDEYDYTEACLAIQAMSDSKPKSGYITETFGGKYFSVDNASKLDGAREFIETELGVTRLAGVALTSLIYAADKIAQTVGHYDAFFNKQAIEKAVIFRAPLPIGTGVGHKVFTEDANAVATREKVEVLYLDPPYNSRQYSDAYHVLENIARWEKPAVFGVAQKMDRTSMKSKYSTRAASDSFDDLVKNANAELIVLSYSNTGSSRVTRSNNVLTDEEIINTLSSVGKVSIVNIDYKEFSVGKTSQRDHKERLFLCQIGG
jgi:adenine-specific DNA-methyltransferase